LPDYNFYPTERRKTSSKLFLNIKFWVFCNEIKFLRTRHKEISELLKSDFKSKKEIILKINAIKLQNF